MLFPGRPVARAEPTARAGVGCLGSHVIPLPPAQSCFVPLLRVDGDVCTHAKWPFPVQPTLNDLAGLSSPFRDRHSCHSCSLTEELKGSFPEGIQAFAVGVPVCAAGRVSGQVVWRGALAGVCGQPAAGPLLPAWRWFSPLPLLT